MYLGLDLGTSGLKGILIDEAQRVIGSAAAPLVVTRPHDGWCEQDPDSWIVAASKVIADLTNEFPAQMKALRGIGLSGQMHGATLIDKAGNSIRPCILWNDTRSHVEAAELDAIPKFRALSGNIVFPGFTAPKLLWLQRNEPRAFAKIHKVLLPKDTLRHWLTGDTISDMSDASGTSWLDVGERNWSDDLLAATGLSRAQMPDLVEGSAGGSRLRDALASRWNLPEGSSSPAVPVTTRPRPSEWGWFRRATRLSRSVHRACCLPPTTLIGPSPKAQCTRSATRCPANGTRWG